MSHIANLCLASVLLSVSDDIRVREVNLLPRLTMTSSPKALQSLSPSSGLLTLPSEVLSHCFLFLCAHDILSCKNSCRRFFHLVKGDFRLQVILELTICHASLESCKLDWTSSEQLNRLQQRERAWSTLPVQHASAFSLVGVHSPLIMTGGGVITFMMSGSLDADEDMRLPTVLESCILPSPWTGIEGIQRKRLVLRSVPLERVVSYATDPSQDLLIIVAYTGEEYGNHAIFGLDSNDFALLVLSLSGDTKHAKAAHRTIPAGHLQLGRFDVGMGAWRHSQYAVLIRGALVATYSRGQSTLSSRGLHVLNWQTGATHSITVFGGNVNDATFVSDHDILVFLPRRGVFVVVFICDERLAKKECLHVIARFYLPIVKGSATYADPVLWGRQVIGDGVAVATARVIDSRERGMTLDAFDIVIRLPDLLKAAHGRWRKSRNTPKEFLWASWGSFYSHIFNRGIIDTLTLSISGYRLACSTPVFTTEGGLHASTCVYVLDFNPKTTARALENGEDSIFTGESRTRVGNSLMGEVPPIVGHTRSAIVTGSYPRTIVGSPDDEGIRSHLPYRITTRTYETLFETVVLDEDHITAMSVVLKNDGTQDVTGNVYSM
ncbi:hypothetical protein PENSPDRAFT_688071 [Peniophora sp. CONT]|nr:hypothetical protein PENSPDRAFT_688071 [Peniophora sp. CONT]